MKDKLSKHKAIRKHLLSGLSITGKIAWEHFGVYRLSSIINRLRKKGMYIKTDMENGYAKYWLVR